MTISRSDLLVDMLAIALLEAVEPKAARVLMSGTFHRHVTGDCVH